MSIFEETFKLINWKNKRRERPPDKADMLYRWEESAFRSCHRVLANLKSEGKTVEKVLWLYEVGGVRYLAVTQQKKEKGVDKQDPRWAGIKREEILGKEE